MSTLICTRCHPAWSVSDAPCPAADLMLGIAGASEICRHMLLLPDHHSMADSLTFSDCIRRFLLLCYCL